MFEMCKDTFPKEATIKCIENRLPGSIDITIMAIPCDGIIECRDGIDESCEEDKWILATVITALFLITILIYLYLLFIRLPSWNKSILKDFDIDSVNNGLENSSCSEMKGNALATLKVFPLRK